MDKRTNSQQKLHLRQSERGLSLTAQLLDYDGTPYNLTGLSVRFKDAKAGGKSVSDDNVTVSTDPKTGVVTYPVHSQVFAADGIGWFELYNTGGTLVDSTQNIVIKVEQDISGTIDNSDYISGLDGIKAQLQGIVNSAQQTLDNAVSGANTAASNANQAAQAAQTLANDIPNNPKYRGPQGVKGDDGKTPYFHTAWSYSADGTDGFTTVYPNLNLFTGTSDKPSTITGGNWNQAIIGVYKTPKVGQEYTLSVEVPEADHDAIMEVYRWNNAGARIDAACPPTLIKSGEKAHTTFTWPDPGDSGATQFAADLAWTNGTDTGTYSYCKAKLEIGNTASPWMPSASEVTTADWPSYIGQYTDFTQADSTNPADYNWALFKGADGKDGKDGTGIQLKGSADSVDKLPATGNTTGDTYLVAGHLYIWESNAWADGGELQGPKGDDGRQVWLYPFDRGDNQTSSYWSDLRPVPSATNPPKVGDTLIDINGNLYQITRVTVKVDPTYGGGTFDYGSKIINLKGATGAPGAKGDTGNTGATGPAGPAGKSAYQVWLDAGNTGTEADYLASLKGATGPAGKDGTTPDLTPYLKSTDAANTYQTPTQVQARVDAKIVPVADETTASSDSSKNTTVLYLVPEAS
jgi:hypothetical protein